MRREEAEVFETLDTRRDHDQQVGVARGRSGERMRQSRRHQGEVSWFGDNDLVAHEELHRSTKNEEQLRGVRMMVRVCTIDAVVQRHALRTQTAGSCRAVDEEPDRLRRKPDEFRLCRAYHDGRVATRNQTSHAEPPR